MKRRNFIQLSIAGAALSSGLFRSTVAAEDSVESPKEKWNLRYMLASCMYGYMYIGEILPEISVTGSEALDIWPKVHGNQREQLDDLGEETFVAMLNKANTKLGCITQYKLGPFGLREEMKLSHRLGCETIVTGARGPKGLSGTELKSAVMQFVEKMKPHLEVAGESNVVVAIENHGNNLIESPDSLKWLAELSEDLPLGIALAPYHLPQDALKLADLIKVLDNKIRVFYAWQHGAGCMEKMPKERELLQMPGRGELDFGPIVRALREINYAGWTEIFMHPVPRGVPILETAKQVSDEINRSRKYLDQFVI